MESFLAERHARFHTPEREVFALARRAAGREPLGREQIAHGFDNEVYAVALQAGYGEHWPFGPALEERLLLNDVGVQIGYLAHFIRSSITPEIAPGAAALRRTLNAWRARPR